MRGSKISGLFLTLLLSLTTYRTTDAAQGNKLQSAVVVGSVYCDTCSQQDFSKSSHFISGATVAVECKEGPNSNLKARFRQEVKTNEHGEFKVNLPFLEPKHVKKIETCSVKLMSSSEPSCSVASAAATSSLQLKSRKEGAHLFSAGSLTFKPLKQPETCKGVRPSIRNSKELETQKTGIPAVGDLPPIPLVPDLPVPPLPELPPLPPLPSIPKLPPPLALKSGNIKTEATAGESQAAAEAQKSSILPPIPFLPPIPNPLQPAPVLPPNPLLPPPSPLIPNPFQPPPSPLIPLPPNPLMPPLPPIPGLTPLPPSPPAFPIPLPPFPFPGVPPAASKSQKISSP